MSCTLAVFAFGNDGGAQLRPEIIGQLVKMRVAIDLDGHFCGVADDVAVVAPVQVLFELRFGRSVDAVVQVIGKLFQKFRALHGCPSPPRCFLKYFVKRSRNCNRARNNLDLTAGILKPSASAVSSVESPSTSRSTNTVRKLGGRP